MEKTALQILGVISLVAGTFVGIGCIASRFVDPSPPLIYFQDRELHAALFLAIGTLFLVLRENMKLHEKNQGK